MNDPIQPQIISDAEEHEKHDGHLEAIAYSGTAKPFEKFLGYVDEKGDITEQILEIIASLPAENRIHLLEVGPGTGITLAGYTDKFGNVTLIEASEDLAAELETKFPTAEVLNSTVEEVNLGTLKHRPDLIVASHVVRYFKNPLEQIQRMYDVLAPGGKIVLIMSDAVMEDGKPSQYTKFIQDCNGILGRDNEYSVEKVKNHLASKREIDYGTFLRTTNFDCATIEEFLDVLPVIVGVDQKDLTDYQRNEICALMQSYYVPKTGLFHLDVGHSYVVINKPQSQTAVQEG